MFFGLWLLPLGYLVIKSGYVPKPLGVLLIIGCIAYIASLFIRVLAPPWARAMNGSLVFKEQHQAHIHYSRDS